LIAKPVLTIALRAFLKTVRQPFQLFPLIFFPAILLAINASGLTAATELRGFPTHSYLTFAIAVAYVQGALFALVNAGTNLAEDIESGFFTRLALTPLSRAALLGGLLIGIAAVGVLQSLVYLLIGAVAGAHLHGGLPGAFLLLGLGAFASAGFGAGGIAAALLLRSGEAVQGLFPLFFVLLILSSANLPRNLLHGWFHTVATYNPFSYLIEGFRAVYLSGFPAGPLLGAVAVIAGTWLLFGSAAVALLWRSLRPG